jgi:hypothetical protein
MPIAAPAANWIACSQRRASSACPAPTATPSTPALAAFGALHDEEPGTFYLTDYLARHFDTLIVKGLGLDRHPELFDDYFRNYRRLVYLAQSPTPT